MLKTQLSQLQNDTQNLRSARETELKRLGELEKQVDRLKDEKEELAEENEKLKVKHERVAALGSIDELEEEQERIENLGGLDQIEEEQERIENLGGLDQLEEEHDLIQDFDNFDTAQKFFGKIEEMGGYEAFEETVTWLEEIFGNLDEAQRFMEKIRELEDMDILEQEHDWVQSLGGLEAASSTYEYAIDNHDVMVGEVEKLTQRLQDRSKRQEWYETFFKRYGVRFPRNEPCSVHSFAQMSHEDLATRAWMTKNQSIAIENGLSTELEEQKELVRQLRSQMQHQNRQRENLQRQSKEHYLALSKLHQLKSLELQRLKQMSGERIQGRPDPAGATLEINPKIAPSTSAYAAAILEAAKASIKKQMTKSRACNPVESWYHWVFAHQRLSSIIPLVRSRNAIRSTGGGWIKCLGVKLEFL